MNLYRIYVLDSFMIDTRLLDKIDRNESTELSHYINDTNSCVFNYECQPSRCDQRSD